jgi:arylsulfatase A-like enzyme
VATLSRAKSRGRRQYAGLWELIDILLCGSLAWLGLLLLEIAASGAERARLFGRAAYLVELSCRYSALFGVPLLAMHAARAWLVRRGRRVDLLISLLLLAALAVPTYRQAALLSSGSMLLDSRFAVPVQLAALLVLLGANLGLWHVHLLLCRAPGYTPWRPLARALRRTERWPRGTATAVWLVAGLCLLVAFAETVGRGLRAYVFFTRFLLPSAWLFATTLLFALQLRLSERRHWLRAGALALLALGLCAGLLMPRDVRRAKAEFERRGGVIALTDLSVSIQRGAPSANLDISRPSRFHCPVPEIAPLPSALPTPAPLRRNVILISVDTLRKDALTMQLDGKPAAPELRSLAAHSVSFERAVTTYPATLFALGSALTGQSPSEVLFAPKPPANLFTQTQALFDEQWIALPSAGWFRRSPVPELLTQVVTPTFWPSADKATTWMLARLRAARAAQHRTFAWIHFYEPHGTQVSGRGSSAEQSARASYAGLVQTVDAQIGRFLRALDRLGYLRDSLLIVFSDHGEALGELDYYGHHVYLNDFATDVPLIVHAPGLTAQHSERQVLLSDIAPSVLEWMGAPLPSGDARSLFATAQDDRYVLSEAFPIRGPALYDVARVAISNPQSLAERMQLIRTAAIDYQPKVSLVSARYRLIVNRETGAEEFYDRIHDPAEEHDLSQDDLPAAHDMREALRQRQRQLSERIYCRVALAH